MRPATDLGRRLDPPLRNGWFRRGFCAALLVLVFGSAGCGLPQGSPTSTTTLVPWTTEIATTTSATTTTTQAVTTTVAPTTTTPTTTEAPTTTEPEAPGALTIKIVSVNSPIYRGQTATLKAKTLPGAECSIVVYYKSGPSHAQGLDNKTASGKGYVSWTWKVGTRTTPGEWPIDVEATLDGDTASASASFTVRAR